jgi:hypothetical protein
MQMILRANEGDRREIGHNPHAARFAEAHSLSPGGCARHADVIGRMRARAKISERQAAYDRLQASHVENFENFETDDAVFRSFGGTSGPDAVARSASGHPSQKGHAAIITPAMCFEPPQSTGAASGPGGREADADMRIALHESSHATAGRVLGQPLGGVTCDADPASGYSGRCWGPQFESRFATGGESAPSLCARMAALMPGPGESRADTADIVLHVHNRVVELCAGSVGEELFLDGPAWDAVDDRKQERALAALVTSSPESAEAFIAFCRVEARELLRRHEYIVHALAAELLIRRTLTGIEIDSVIARAVAAKALADEHARRADWRRVEESAARFLAGVTR